MTRSQVHEVLALGQGILRLEPCWVPRSFRIPGRRLRLHPDDLYAFGADRAEAFAKNWGYRSVETDRRRMVARKDIDLIEAASPAISWPIASIPRCG